MWSSLSNLGATRGGGAFQRGQAYLAQGRQHKETQDLNQARHLLSQAEDEFKQARPSDTLTKETLKAHRAQTRLEQGDILCALGLMKEARTKYEKAGKYCVHFQSLWTGCCALFRLLDREFAAPYLSMGIFILKETYCIVQCRTAVSGKAHLDNQSK